MVLCENCKASVADNPKIEEQSEWPITCSDCKVETTVPFKPRPGWAVHCRDCYKKRKQ